MNGACILLDLYSKRAIELEQELDLERSLMHRPMHTSALRGFAARFPLFAPTVRLVKRWLAAHLFSDFLTEEAVELLCVPLFTRSGVFHTPGSAFTGLHRFLHLLATRDWEHEPLVIDVTGDMTAEQYADILVV